MKDYICDRCKYKWSASCEPIECPDCGYEEISYNDEPLPKEDRIKPLDEIYHD